MRNSWPRTAALFGIVVTIALSLALPLARAQEIKTETFLPNGAKGAIVVVLSSVSGPNAHVAFARLLASTGYYVVLADGRDFIVPWGSGDLRGVNGAAELRRLIASAQSAPQAIPGKVAVVGFALGGAAALKHAAPVEESVSAVVAFYPILKLLGSDIRVLAPQLKSPVLLLVGEKDTWCCYTGSVQELVGAPKPAFFELGSYPSSGHAFDVANSPGYSSADASDAIGKAIAFLKRVHPAAGK
jgi:dienelactone hydrolase